MFIPSSASFILLYSPSLKFCTELFFYVDHYTSAVSNSTTVFHPFQEFTLLSSYLWHYLFFLISLLYSHMWPLWYSGTALCGWEVLRHTSVQILFFLLFFSSKESGHFHGNLWTKGDHLMEASYLKAHPLEGRYPEWTPNFHSDRSQYLNLCARGSQGQAPEHKQFHCTTAAHIWFFFIYSFLSVYKSFCILSWMHW